jgi:hypothetical protein
MADIEACFISWRVANLEEILKRSTVNDKPANPREEVLSALMHWIWSWRKQVERLLASTRAQGQGDSEIERRKSFTLASYDEHILVVAGWNLARAIRRASALFPSIQIAEDRYHGLRLLRHLYEHWDKQRPAFQDPAASKEWSGKEFTERFPHGMPWSITLTGQDWLLGGVVGIKEITDSVAAIEKEALELEVQSRKGDESIDGY